MEPTTRIDPAPPLALVPLTNSRAEESYPSITSEAPNGASAEIRMVTDTWFPTETEGSEKVSWPDAANAGNACESRTVKATASARKPALIDFIFLFITKLSPYDPPESPAFLQPPRIWDWRASASAEVMAPSPFTSAAAAASPLNCFCPSTCWRISITSRIETVPSPLQSPFFLEEACAAVVSAGAAVSGAAV